MRKFAADNLMFLREEYPEIYKLIRGKSYDQAAIRPEIAKNGEPIASVVTESGSWQSLYSRYNPSLEADRWAQSLADAVSETKDVLFCGFGLGYHLEAFLKLYPEKRVYLYEPYVDTLLYALEQRDLRSILMNKQIAMFGIGNTLETQVEFIENAFNTSSNNLRLVDVPVYKLAYPGLIENYRQLIAQTAASAASSLRTLERFRKDWARNLILNTAFNLLTPSIKGMKGVCHGIPAIVVGSGPSLEMEKDSLRRLKNHALIIAAGTSIMALRKFDIEPDLVVTMDPGEYNYRAFTTLELRNIPLLYIPTVHSGVLREKNKYKIHAFFNLDAPTAFLMGLTDSDPIFASTATVSGTAIQAAIFLGCNEIVFIGQDYSFPNNQFYSEGVSHAPTDVLQRKMNQSTEEVLNVNGGMNRSNRIMTVSRQGIEQLIYMNPHCTFYNASNVGAKIENTHRISLDELYEKKSSTQFEDDWFNKLIELYAKKYDENRMNAIRSRVFELHRKSFHFEHGVESLKRHILIADKLTKTGDELTLKKWLIRFEEIWKPIIDDESFKFVYGFFFQRELNYLDRNWRDMLDEKEIRVKVTILVELLTPFMQGWDEISPLLRAHLDRLVEILLQLG
ncbi:motility associated factor glycosyltransferase family protein [Cohnella algarum]|uniref:motility associated factor glycosyltransferase family protein n=1 Tax=Cohnella algarum TaxID=2044859 RepID=UPI001966F2E2|nr:6-hydroxymethylpterin diphosphokinase MptE-like protein [Cohnella algarum]MBN2980624.1 motility associated factor glycosyltransferase family protein [Cohnella algarum]